MRILKKSFWVTLFWKQNNWHRHSVLVHTLKVAYLLARDGHWGLVPAALLHDVGKPYVAFRDAKDEITGEYSFTNHEEISYHLIKNLPVSDYTKTIVRYHYLHRGMKKAKEKGNFARYRRLRKIWDKLPTYLKRDLDLFLKYDDLGK
jgi:predicted HD phosphohydrolase